MSIGQLLLDILLSLLIQWTLTHVFFEGPVSRLQSKAASTGEAMIADSLG